MRKVVVCNLMFVKFTLVEFFGIYESMLMKEGFRRFVETGILNLSLI